MELSKMIDHTLLKPDATREEIKTLCEEAKKFQFASVCVNPTWVRYATSLLEGTEVQICTVIGFPLGATTTETKVYETKHAIENGATEVDMVINIGALKSGNLEFVAEDIKSVCREANEKAIVKVIIETSLLTDEEKRIACSIAQEAGADFVKTSTGFSGGGATLKDIQLMREVVGNEMGVKASGGIRSKEDAIQMINAGATRIGTSSGIKIVS